jgi:hypothetical protein
MSINKDTGLTMEEQRCMDALLDAFNAFDALEVQHPSDMFDVVNCIHRMQDILATRIARRHYPAGWPKHEQPNEMPTA